MKGLVGLLIAAMAAAYVPGAIQVMGLLAVLFVVALAWAWIDEAIAFRRARKQRQAEQRNRTGE